MKEVPHFLHKKLLLSPLISHSSQCISTCLLPVVRPQNENKLDPTACVDILRFSMTLRIAPRLLVETVF